MQLSDTISLDAIVDTKVFNDQGDEVGRIHEVFIDPSAGIVRFTVVDIGDQLISLPWASMVLTPSKGGYTLTHLGASIYLNYRYGLSE